MESNNIEFILEEAENLELELENSVVKEYPKLENLMVEPTTEKQIFKSADYYGYNEVEIAGVTNTVDNNITPENIKKDIEILGVAGEVEELNATEIILTPKSIQQTATPEAPYNGFDKVIVEAQNGVDISDYFETTITSSNRNYFAINNMIKNVPVFTVETTSLNMAFATLGIYVSPELVGENKVTNWYYAFYNTNIKELLQYDTSVGVNFSYAFNTNKIETIPLLDLGSATNIANIVSVSKNTLINLGGFKDLGKAYSTSQSENYSSYTLNLSSHTNLTHESLMNVINNLYDIKSKGCNAQKLVLGSTNLEKLTDEEVAIATNKGWNVS